VMRTIKAGSSTLQSMLDAGEIIMVGAMYDVKTGIVTFLDVPD